MSIYLLFILFLWSINVHWALVLHEMGVFKLGIGVQRSNGSLSAFIYIQDPSQYGANNASKAHYNMALITHCEIDNWKPDVWGKWGWVVRTLLICSNFQGP